MYHSSEHSETQSEHSLNTNDASLQQNTTREAITYDPFFIKFYAVCSFTMVAASVAVLIFTHGKVCASPLWNWLLIYALFSALFSMVRIYDFFHFAERNVTSYFIGIFKLCFVVFGFVGQFYVYTHGPSTCNKLLWGWSLTLIILEYLRLLCPSILICTIGWWYPILSRIVDDSASKGASQEAINGLKRRTQNLSTVCVICFDAMGMEDEVRVIPCNHEYHIACLDRWLLVRPVCPLCKRNVFKEETFEDI